MDFLQFDFKDEIKNENTQVELMITEKGENLV
jgi:hypothetical protein